MRLNSVRRCRHCVYGACMGACARHLGRMSQHRRFGTYCMCLYLKSIYTNSAKRFDPNQARHVVRYNLGPNWQRPSTDDKCHGTTIG